MSHYAAKQLLVSAIALPPGLAAVATISGATMRHSHAVPALEHHSMMCMRLYSVLFAGVGPLSVWDGRLAATSAWLLLGVGGLLIVRMLLATARLERGLEPYMTPPSSSLARALVRVGTHAPLPAHRFFECPIPPACSSVLGIFRPRCILSQDLVKNCTDDELDAIVAHEAAHLRAGDAAVTCLVAVLSRLFFYLRPVGWLKRRWNEETELACDAAAAATTRRPLALAAAILRASGAPTGDSFQSGTMALGFADAAVCSPSKRIERLMAQEHQMPGASCGSPGRHARYGWLLILAVSAGAATLLTAPQAVCFAHCGMEAVARLLP